jgi:hypothetical protein
VRARVRCDLSSDTCSRVRLLINACVQHSKRANMSYNKHNFASMTYHSEAIGQGPHAQIYVHMHPGTLPVHTGATTWPSWKKSTSRCSNSESVQMSTGALTGAYVCMMHLSCVHVHVRMHIHRHLHAWP